MKTAVITGITGQDGSYLAELLLEKGYRVVGVVRRTSSEQTNQIRISHLKNNPSLLLENGDLLDLPSLLSIFRDHQPDEIYNLAAQSHVQVSFNQPIFTTETISKGSLNVLEAARIVSPNAKIYLAGSSEMFGNEYDSDGYRRETTIMKPVSPYGCAKVYGFHLGRTYREAYKMFVCNGILFNHESPRRGLKFVTNKVVHGAVAIKKGHQDSLFLGNLDATRDWGHAKDYVRGMWQMMQQDNPDDFVLATGKSHSIRDLCYQTFSRLGLDYQKYVKTNSKYYRPYELDDLRGDPTKAEQILNWERDYSFESMLEEMLSAAYNEAKEKS